ncbi:hypothetical protein LUZ61_012687 [Rhynchospora tenuis]|uniref:NB-ARC domain-containing protein n=1 Tax=Rhynchospora tenuis TaxID=198213 RepID=A0AAD6A3F4_9POAL|nr:hypothetical protein LUZ61_012687 [Rhynchospora tenuis]
MDPNTDRSSPRRQLQGPKPPRLSINKESHKIRKAPPRPAPPPHATTTAEHAPHFPDARPLHIYDASPQIIDIKPSDWISHVLSLTGQNSDADLGATSPATSLTTIEKSVTHSSPSPSLTRNPMKDIIDDDLDDFPYISPLPLDYLEDLVREDLSGENYKRVKQEDRGTLLEAYGLELKATKEETDQSSNARLHEQLVVEKGSCEQVFEVGGSSVFGWEDDKNKIFELILGGYYINQNPNIVSVVADRGIGRTTILNLIHNDARELIAFDSIRFICMPEEFDDKDLMRVVIQSLSHVPCNITDIEILKEIAIEELRDNKVLLLLDNFENNTQKCWDLLSMLLNVCAKESSIVVSTTRKAVAEVMVPMHFYYLNHLSDELCWSIFKHGAFFSQNLNAKSDLLDVGKHLVAKCKNNVLCIKLVSGLVRHSLNVDWWRAVLDSDFWEIDEMEGDVLPALRICYEFLPPYLKKCFNYCSLFPTEHIFLKQCLVQIWLSQGFIEPGESKELETIGLEYFDELLSRSFFQPSPIHDTKEEKFMMPGLVHDFVQKLCKNQYFRSEGYMQQAPGDTCHLSLVPHEFHSVSLKHLTAWVHNLQTFIVLNPQACHYESIYPPTINIVELDDLFKRFMNLTMLKLDNTDIAELPPSIMLLKNLLFLGLSNTNIKRIPMEVSNLVQLETVEARNCHYLEELPKAIEALTNLVYLDVTKEAGYVVMPCGIGKLTNLRRLATFNVGTDPLIHCGIEELKYMEHLKGCLQISGLLNVRSGIDAKEAHIRSKEEIETLSLYWSDGKIILEGEEGAEIAEEVLQNLHPNDNLKEVIIRDYPGNTFPMWIKSPSFSRLISVIFDHCYNCEKLPNLGALPSLRFLSVQKMYRVQTMNLSNSEFIPENGIRYPSLEQLNICEMYELEDWFEIRNQDFPCIRSLSINKCSFLRKIPKFASLVELSIYSCSQFLEFIDLPSLQSLHIEGLQKTRFVRLPRNLIRLKKLEISYCPELLSIEGLSELNSLKTIKVIRCPKLDLQGNSNMKRDRHTSVLARGKQIASTEGLVYSGSDLIYQERDQPRTSKIALTEGLEFSASDLTYQEQDQPRTSKKRKAATDR